jgi:hypothetical protein
LLFGGELVGARSLMASSTGTKHPDKENISNRVAKNISSFAKTFI